MPARCDAMKLLPHCRGVLLGLLCLLGGHSRGDEPMRYVYHPPESPLDKRYLYHWKILETALERTNETSGPCILEPSTFMAEKPQLFELRQAAGKLTVMYLRMAKVVGATRLLAKPFQPTDPLKLIVGLLANSVAA